ncbi:PLP-dependent transferase [candidate division KSB1 bacterium]|nr:PLP-dependent aspartate aminotransferase family protein [bacterium]NUM65413.1 PLP-dependent transferase [candidate division KSB1 bacterium]
MKAKAAHRATKAIHAGGLHKEVFGEVSVPIFQCSTFAFPSAEEGAARFAGEHAGYIYTRMGNPTVQALEECIAALENGYAGMATASGMAAITTVYLALLGQGAHVVGTDSVYGPTRMVLEKEFARFGVTATFVDTSNLENLQRALRANTRLVFVETPANPTMTVTDIRAAAEIAHRHDAILVVDNTFASPYLQRPLELGADVVVHSMTKSINGHSDVVAGMIITKNENLYRRIKPVLNLFGGTMDPHQAWLVLRGVRTMPLRVERSQENARKLADFLQQHPNVTWVHYPGLPDHPQHAVARRQMDGFGSMICFGVKNGLAGGKMVMDSVRLFTLAVSLGGVESLIEHPASMTHASVPRQEREQAGIGDELVRLAVGCENFDDLREDLDQALNKIPA